MNDGMVIDFGIEAIKIVFLLSGPLLIATLVVGLMVSVFQAVTQINEATLTFIPKMIAVVVVLAVMAPWMVHVMSDYAANIFGQMNDYIR